MDTLDKLMKEHPELFVKPDPELMKLVDELVDGVELDDDDNGIEIIRV